MDCVLDLAGYPNEKVTNVAEDSMSISRVYSLCPKMRGSFEGTQALFFLSTRRINTVCRTFCPEENCVATG